MAIEYVEIRGTDRVLLGILDTAKSIIWHTEWYGTGDFEIYAKATTQNISFLQIGRYVTRPNDSNIGIIETITVVSSITDGNMITATGRFAKSILDRRIIYNLSGTVNKATVLSGSVESAARALVANSLISCTFDSSRNVGYIELGTLHSYPEIIVDEDGASATKQVSYENLLEYTDELLQEYGLSAWIILDGTTKKLQYEVRKGTDRSIDNSGGYTPVIFCKEYDNLTDSNYNYDISAKKDFALIGGTGEDLDRFYATLNIHTGTPIERREVFVDARSLSKKYKDDTETEQEYTDAQYTTMLKTQGKQTLAELTETESFAGTIILSGQYTLNTDFYLGDIVTVQENSLNKYVDVRITEVTEVQDENGYTVDAVYE